jgi:hypothetical protein
MRGFGQCSRCGMWAVEHLRTHSHCWECNYSPQSEIKSRVRKQLHEERLSGIDFQENEITDRDRPDDEFEDEFDVDDEFLEELARRESVK